jgi:hypothetical protein
MNKFVSALLVSIFSLSAQAAVYGAGSVYAYSFETMSYQGVSQGDIFENFAKMFVNPAWGAETDLSAESSFEIRLYEDSDGSGSPFYSYQNTESDFPLSHIVGVIGLGWPAGTWADMNGRIEIEVFSGRFNISDVGVTVEIDGLVYTSVSSVPVPGAAWLFASALLGMGATRSAAARRRG